ncbi:hypothetical protein [Amycolatopsis sp. NPDC049868]|uniref:hypothetical protein n=1 Tax=Amycolatopsis sp. NPDC049868 TaxID=3363934 RepID=UPI00379FAE44
MSGLVAVEPVYGPVVWSIAAVGASVALAAAVRRKDGSPGRNNVFPGTRTLAWAINGGMLVEVLRAAKVIGSKEGLTFFAHPTREGEGWAVVVDLPAGRKASSAIVVLDRWPARSGWTRRS